jgi:hypothetical protein
MSSRAPARRSNGVTFPVPVIDYGTYPASVSTLAQFAPAAAAGPAGWLDLGADYESLLFVVKGGVYGAKVLIETSEDASGPDAQTIALSAPAGGSDSYEVHGGMRRYYRASANSADAGFAATAVDLLVKGISYQF